MLRTNVKTLHRNASNNNNNSNQNEEEEKKRKNKIEEKYDTMNTRKAKNKKSLFLLILCC